ncbi:23S rRNA (uracil(1939)-C(5))-methyltransferase RlmD [Thalassotalea maritima]|uniref:23S rRNA (uracil(1939)-C(5))-methyltransferase RlmD n=1 Tax=Thalassotalea maritima TaxID=3242416 RepID=UPI003528E7E5
MVKIFQQKKDASLVKQRKRLTIERLDMNGDGVGKLANKPVFVSQSLPGESVEVVITEQKSKYLRAQCKQVIDASSQRVEPKCPHFYQCGGCDLQHMSYQAQVDYKQQKISQLFRRNANLEHLPWQAPLLGNGWHYRRKARIGVQYNKHGEPIVGFRQRGKNVLTPIKVCAVLPDSLQNIFVPLQQLLKQLPAHAVGHCEVIHANQQVVILRVLISLSSEQLQSIEQFAEQHQLAVWLQTDKETIDLQAQPVPAMSYIIDDKTLQFHHNDFLQVNAVLNNKMVDQAMTWLDIGTDDQILDLFAGFGNFSLPMAARAKAVIGVEGVETMVARATANAQANNLDNCCFFQADLNDENAPWPWLSKFSSGRVNKVLLDPARAGAPGAIKRIIELSPDKVLYVSCDAATMARDSAVLLANGYRLIKLSLMDMFAQTRHVESMALFVKR